MHSQRELDPDLPPLPESLWAALRLPKPVEPDSRSACLHSFGALSHGSVAAADAPLTDHAPPAPAVALWLRLVAGLSFSTPLRPCSGYWTARPGHGSNVHPPAHPGQALERRPGRLQAAQDHLVPGHAAHLREPVCLGWWRHRTTVQGHGPRQHHHDRNLQPPTSRSFRRKSLRCGDGGPFQTGGRCGIPSRRFGSKWAHYGNVTRS